MKIVLGISGSIAAYKSALLARELIKQGVEVRVVMTPAATKFIPSLTLHNLTKYPVAVEMFEEGAQQGGSWHIHLARWCDAMMIAPCSATTLGKLAHGICDTALVTVALALPPEKPLLIAPAMDTEMWIHPATQRNISQLRVDGASIIPPDSGELASGFSGAGRLPEISTLTDTVLFALKTASKARYTQSSSNQAPSTNQPSYQDPSTQVTNQPSNQAPSYEQRLREALETPVVSLQDAVDADKMSAELELMAIKRGQQGIKPDAGTMPFPLAGKTVLITAGPTYERIDDVRFIGNYSSGKMGFALAAEARAMGARVQLISGPVDLPTPDGIDRTNIESAREMFDEVMKRRMDADVLILAAAVADFTPIEKQAGKIKKEATGDTMTLHLTKTPDILAAVGAVKRDGQAVVGFALEAANHVDNARKKLADKRCDMIVLNALGKHQSGFHTDDNTITIVEREGVLKEFPPMPKRACAQIILRRTAELLTEAQEK